MSQNVNLFNPILLKQKKYFSALTMLQALGLLVLGCVVLAAYASYSVRSLEQEAAASSAQTEAVRAQLVRVLAEYGPRPPSTALEQEIRERQHGLQELERVSAILEKGELGNTEGYAPYLRAFARQHVQGVWLTGLEVGAAGRELAVHGRALRPELVPAYIQQLKREAVLQGKAFDTLEMHAPREAAQAFVEFKLQ